MPGKVLLFGNTVYSVSVRVKGYQKAPVKLLRIMVIARLEGLASDWVYYGDHMCTVIVRTLHHI